jgi:integrase/recombinase XerD
VESGFWSQAVWYLAEWLAERSVTRPCDVAKPMLDSYQRSLYYRRKPDGSPITFRAQVVRLVPVRTFFRYLARQNRILYNPASELELPKREHRLPRAVLTRLRGRADPLAAADRRAAGTAGSHDHRRTPQARPCSRRGHAVLDGRSEPFTPDRLTDLASLYVRRSGVGKPDACHLFRHTMATLMLEGGADIRFIQQMLGHADISSTQIYTQVSLAALTAVHAATHPAASNQPRNTRRAAAGEPGRQGAVLRPAGDLTPGAGAGGPEALHDALDAEAHEEQQTLNGHDERSAP